MLSLFGKQMLRNQRQVFSASLAPSVLSAQANLMATQRRFFDLHEYQSKYIMGQHGVNVQKGDLAKTPEEALNVAKTLSNKGGLILKAQVKAGGRGKGKLTSGLQGGVQICKTPEEIAEKTEKMIGYNLITH